MLSSYAVLLIEKKDEEGQTQVLSAALEVAFILDGILIEQSASQINNYEH